jgi:hypothetical protein
LDACEALIRQQKAGIEDACVVAEAELEDLHPGPDAREVLESELEQEYAAL